MLRTSLSAPRPAGAARPCLLQTLLASLTVATAPAGAQASDPATPLAEITNTATRTDRRVDDVPATVSVLRAAEIEASGARDIKDLFRHQVDLTVRAAPGRFSAAGGSTGRAGNEGLNVRGLEGNQVLMVVDGVRVPASFSFGPLSTGRGDFLALEATQAVEVLRGPASTQFGSDGLAGAISLRTLDPADLLGKTRSAAGFVRLGTAQIDHSSLLTAAGAFKSGPWQGLLLASGRRGGETDNQARNSSSNANRTAPNPLDYRNETALAKVFFSPAPAHQVGLTLEGQRRRTTTEVLSGRAVPAAAPADPAATAVIDLDAFDHVQRERLALEHRYDDLNGAGWEKSLTRVYRQDAEVRQLSLEDRSTAADRTREGFYRERVTGFSSQVQSSFSGTVQQRISLGLDGSRTEIAALRDGTPNPSAPPPFGETFPVEPFPDTAYTLFGAFVQNEIESGAFSLIPGLRLDRYRLAPSPNGYTGGAIVSLSDQAVTPRLGLVWRASPLFAPYAQWATGFRAPTPAQVNNGFTNVAAGYRSIGNPDLSPERAESVEIGLRGQASGWRWQLAAYHNRYRDFISQEVVAGAGTAADPTIFQSINLARARIRGVELRGQWQLARHWSLSGAAAAARGTSTRGTLQEPLDSVEPARASLGLRYDIGHFALHADLLHEQAQARERIRAVTPAAFAPPGYSVLDLGVRWQPLPSWTLWAQLNNATDQTYWRWSDVRGLADNSLAKDAYTAPGRHLQVTLRHDF